MEQKLLFELPNHYIYYFKTEVINYYVNIPKNKCQTTISIELKSKMDNFNLETNDEIWVMENIKNTYLFIDQYNITLVLPILNDECISILEKMNTEKFEVIDKLLGYIINHTYVDLKSRELDIENNVIMINNDRYKTFINWFSTKYGKRVQLKRLLELIQSYNASATVYKKIETPNISFVVGTYNDEVNAPKIIKDEPDEIPKLTPARQNAGFTNYFLLVIIILVVAGLIFLLTYLYK